MRSTQRAARIRCDRDASHLSHEPVAPLVAGKQLPPEYDSEMSPPTPPGEYLLSPILRKLQLLHPHLFTINRNPSAPATTHPFCPSSSPPPPFPCIQLQRSPITLQNPRRERGRCPLESDHASLLRAKIYSLPDIPRQRILRNGVRPRQRPRGRREVFSSGLSENSSDSISSVKIQGGVSIGRVRGAPVRSSQL